MQREGDVCDDENNIFLPREARANNVNTFFFLSIVLNYTSDSFDTVQTIVFTKMAVTRANIFPSNQQTKPKPHQSINQPRANNRPAGGFSFEIWCISHS